MLRREGRSRWWPLSCLVNRRRLTPGGAAGTNRRLLSSSIIYVVACRRRCPSDLAQFSWCTHARSGRRPISVVMMRSSRHRAIWPPPETTWSHLRDVIFTDVIKNRIRPWTTKSTNNDGVGLDVVNFLETFACRFLRPVFVFLQTTRRLDPNSTCFNLL